MDFEELWENPGFWILSGISIGAEILGWIISKKSMGYSFPLWQLGIIILGTLVAAAYFSTRD